MTELCPDCGRVVGLDKDHCAAQMMVAKEEDHDDCVSAQIRHLRQKLAEAERENKALVSAARAVVAADTYPMPGKTRFEATTEAIGKLEALLPELPAGCATVDKAGG